MTTEPNRSTCPWCGAGVLLWHDPMTYGESRIVWKCGSSMRGGLRQSLRCERNVLYKEVERLRRLIEDWRYKHRPDNYAENGELDGVFSAVRIRYDMETNRLVYGDSRKT